MDNLTSKQRAFIRQMCETEELAAHGFRLLVKTNNPADYFDALNEAGLFDADKNPAPVPVEAEGYVRISYWAALDYLVELARISGELDDLDLASKVMRVVRNVSSWRDEAGKPQENYHTSQKFATILGLVPAAIVTDLDMQFVSLWLSNRFDTMLVSQAIDESVLPRFLSSPHAADWRKALIALECCTVIAWEPKKNIGEGSPHTVVAHFWLSRLISHHVPAFGEKLGPEASALFERRVREAFRSEIHRDHSEIFRPAIEEHNQNHEFRAAENIMVSGLRDVLLAWADCDPKGASEYVERLIGDDLEIVRRIGIYTINVRWTVMGALYPKLLRAQVFTLGHLHELYDLLDEHFATMGDSDQRETLEAIRNLPLPNVGIDPTATKKRFQQRWLSALKGKGCQAADEWSAQLAADADISPVPEHPDFSAYMTTWQGPGSSPFSIAELTGFASENVLSKQLNRFQEESTMRGPTLEGLASTLQEAARNEPQIFISALPDLAGAKPRFQQSVTMGLADAWRADETTAPRKWGGSFWNEVITFFERVVRTEDFWQQQDDGPRDWLVSAIADFLHAGTKKDEHAYPEEFLPRTLALLANLLANASGADDFPNDPMMQALNTPKGRIIEALFSQALRACRLSDKRSNSHDSAWEEVRPLFETEIVKCRNANYEFSTQCGANLAQLDYLNLTWTTEAVPAIFPLDYPNNEKCALSGLAYGAFTKSVYEHLTVGGALDRGLQHELTGRDARERLLDRIGAAYLWDMESLDSPRFQYFFAGSHVDDLVRVTWMFSTAKNQELTERQIERILQFWERCTAYGNSLSPKPSKLLSSLSALACYVESAEGQNRELLLSVAPYVHREHSSYEFLEELLRLVEVSPDGVVDVLTAMVTAHIPAYDYDDKLLALLRTLAKKGKRLEVIRLLEHLRTLPKMQEFFDELTGFSASEGARL